MKSADKIMKTLMGVSEEEQNGIKAVIFELDEILKAGTVSEETCRKLTNSITTLEGMKEGYMWRLLAAAKQNHML